MTFQLMEPAYRFRWNVVWPCWKHRLLQCRTSHFP